MDNYIPHYVKQYIDYKKGETLGSTDFNNIMNLLIIAADYNSDVLNSLCNDVNTVLIKNAVHADVADNAVTADNSMQLSGATLSRSINTVLENNDNKIPSSKQAKDYIDSRCAALHENIILLSQALADTITVNNEQNNRLANIDTINNRYGTLITALDGRLTTAESAITNIRSVDLEQDATLASHNQRITNLELGEVPPEVLSTLMTKGGYALNTGEVDQQGRPIYSADTVTKANAALNLLVNNELIPANAFELKSTIIDLKSKSFLTRGDYPASDYYKTVASLATLELGAYYVSAAVSQGLGLGNNAGTLRLYPCENGYSLEFEIQTGNNAGTLLTAFVASSVIGTTPISSLDWYNARAALGTVADEVQTLADTRLTISNLNEGADISITKSGNNATFNYTGPKIVISATQPAADPNRQILWIQL